MQQVWVLADDRPGNVNQCLGIAESLLVPFIKKQIVYNKFARVPNLFKWHGLWGVDEKHSDAFQPPWPDLVISAGRKCAPIAIHIKEHASNPIRVVQLMKPDMDMDRFDLIVLPEHDGVFKQSQVISSVGAPNRITDAVLAKAESEWQPKFAHLPAKKIGLILGGSTSGSEFTDAYAELLLSRINQMALAAGAGVIVTTSRRTPESAAQMVRTLLTCPSYIHEWNDPRDNPYFGILQCSDWLVVTGDSMSMCSEACASGKPVYIYSPEGFVGGKYIKLHADLYQKGYARPFLADLQELAQWSYAPLREAERIAGYIMSLGW